MPKLLNNTRFGLVFGMLLVLAVAAASVAWPTATVAEPTKTADVNPDLARARREVRLLDDIYKTAIVLITKHYVQEDSDLAAGEAFKALFAGVKEKGWHEVRLLDATGEQLNEANAPKDAFEKKAVQALLAGKPLYEEQVEEDGKSYLRVATPLPIALEKCKMCHSNYRDQKVIGALGYKLPLESKDAGR